MTSKRWLVQWNLRGSTAAELVHRTEPVPGSHRSQVPIQKSLFLLAGWFETATHEVRHLLRIAFGRFALALGIFHSA